MPLQLSIFIFMSFIVWLFVSARKLYPMNSKALWIPLLWLVIIGSRPVSYWFNFNIPDESIEDYVEGSPIDRNVFLFLLIAGFVVLWKRRLYWGRILRQNKWFFAFFLYCAISMIWSDYPFVSFKRWIKDFGNVIMIMIVLTEADRVKATKAVFARFTYLAVPLSVVFIKYLPSIGRGYSPFTWTPTFTGVTTNKNELGMILVVCGLFLVWDLFGGRGGANESENPPECPPESPPESPYQGMFESTDDEAGESRWAEWADLLGRITLLGMLAWLLVISNSSTAIACLILGICSYFLLQIKKVAGYLGTYSIILTMIVLALFLYDPGMFVRMLGRDTTLTGRTDLWADLLHIRIHPWIGEGYKSFWLGPWVVDLWDKYAFRVNQAHNGYLEIYLNGGWIGVCLLLSMLASAGIKLKHELLNENRLAIFCFPLFFAALVSNLTEATFNMLSISWFVIILSALDCPPSPSPSPGT